MFTANRARTISPPDLVCLRCGLLPRLPRYVASQLRGIDPGGAVSLLIAFLLRASAAVTTSARPARSASRCVCGQSRVRPSPGRRSASRPAAAVPE